MVDKLSMISGSRYNRVATCSVMKPWLKPPSALPPPRRISPCETEVADLQSTVAVNQKVTRLGVMVDGVDGVNVLETARDLINKKPGMSE